MISGKARIAGIIGWPVSHSLSPKLHNYWLERYGIDGAYVPMPVKPEDFAEIMIALPKMGFSGVNLTLPHKELVLPMLDSMDENARIAGMANTIIVDKGKLHGMNTDSYGFIENIHQCLPLQRHKAVILGAGGAARAVCHALLGAGFEMLTVCNRSLARAESLAKQWPGVITPLLWEKRAEALAGADLLVNATSLGMVDSDPLEMDIALLPPHALVTDIVYTPLLTPLLENAMRGGYQVVDGLGMLLHQAVPAFEAWFGHKPEVNGALRKYILGDA